MLKLLTCARGHFWESDSDAARCPECGGDAEGLPQLDLDPAAPPVPTTPAPKPPLEAAGRPVLPGYDILEDLGRGPTGFRLYRARQQVVNREVLLEVVFAREDTTQRAWSALRSEAGLLGKLAHPHILAVHDAGERDRQLFFNAVEWVVGPTLAKHAAEPVPVTSAVRLVELLARAIEEAHRRDVVHRHLEPAKVLLQPAGAEAAGVACRLHGASFIPRITGFGLTRRPVEGEATDTELFADAGFLSPEQAWGRSKDIGPATDVYGLGGILYYLLTGRPPFRGPTLGDTLDAVQTARLVPPSEFRRVPADVVFVCAKALSRSPRQRHASAADLADDLRRVSQHRPPTGAPSGLGTRLGRWARRGPAALMTLALVACLVTAWAAYRAGASRGAPSSRALIQAQNQRDQARSDAASLRMEIDAWKQEKRLLAYRHKLGRVLQALEASNAVQAGVLLESCAHEDRGVEWHHLRRRAATEPPAVVPAGGATTTLVSFHPRSADVLAVARRATGLSRMRGHVELYQLPAWGKRLTIELPQGPVRSMAFSPDGALLAVTSSKLAVYHTQGGVAGAAIPKLVFEGGNAGVAWSPNGTFLALTSSSGTVSILSLRGEWREGTAFDPGRKTEWSRVAYRPDGEVIAAFAHGDSEVSQYLASNVVVGRPSLRGPGVVHAFAFAPSGEAAVARSDDSIRFHEPRIGQEVGLVENIPKPIRQLAFSPDGSRLAAALDGGVVKLFARAGRSWHELTDLPGDGTLGLSFNATGRALAACGAKGVLVYGSVAE